MNSLTGIVWTKLPEIQMKIIQRIFGAGAQLCDDQSVMYGIVLRNVEFNGHLIKLMIWEMCRKKKGSTLNILYVSNL